MTARETFFKGSNLDEKDVKTPYKELEAAYLQAIKDLKLLQKLAELDLFTGRKTNAFKELHAKMNIKQSEHQGKI